MSGLVLYGAGGAGKEMSCSFNLTEGRAGDLALYGAGGAGRGMTYALSLSNGYGIVGFVDDTMEPGKRVNGVPVLGGYEWLEKQDQETDVVICIVGVPKVKRGLVAKIRAGCPAVRFPVVVNPLCGIAPSSIMGEGSVMGQIDSYIMPDCVIGDFVWINYQSFIGHDSVVGDYTTIYNNVCCGGNVHIGNDCVIGSGVTMRPGAKVGNGAVIGAGAVVIKDIPDNTVAVGNPAKVIREIKSDG